MLTTLLCSAVLALPQDEGNVQDPPPVNPANTQGRTLPLRVDDVARFALERAPGIRQAHLSALANVGSVQEADGIFDPVFFADATGSYTESPTPGGFLNSGITSVHARRLDMNQGIRTLLTTGGSITLNVNENYQEDNLPPGFFGINPESNVNMSLTVTQPLLRGGWGTVTEQQFRQAEISYNRGMADMRVSEFQNLQAAIDAFWDLSFAREDVEVKQLSVDLAEELKGVTEARYRVGSAAEVEVVQTESDIATRTDQLLTAKNLVKQSEDGLRTLIFNLEEQTEWALDLIPVSQPPEPVPTAMIWQDAFETALRHRAEMKQLRLDVQSAQLAYDAADWNLLPQLDLTASGSSRGIGSQVYDAFSPAFGIRAHGYSIGFTLEVPLGNNGARGAERRSWFLLQLSQRALRDFEHSLAAEVRDAVRNVNFFSDRVRTTAKAAEVAQRTLEAEQRRLDEGASTNFQVLQFQRDLAEALSAEKSARYSYAKSATALHLVQGLNWDGAVPPALPIAEDLDY